MMYGNDSDNSIEGSSNKDGGSKVGCDNEWVERT